MLKPSVRPAPTRKLGTTNVRDISRTTGTTLQNRRFKLWTQNPYCSECGRLCAYPEGFELDHIIPLYTGGPDTEDNCQILCVWLEVIDGKTVKRGCHADKTKREGKDPNGGW